MRPDEIGVAHLIVRAVVADHEHIERGDPAFLGEADLHPAVEAGTRAADVVLFLAADAHHDRRVRLLRQQRGNDQRDSAGDLAAESAAGVFADEDDVVGIDAQPARDRRNGLRGALRAACARRLCRSASTPSRVRVSRHWWLVFGVTKVSSRTSAAFLKPGVDIADRPFIGRLAHRQTAFLGVGEIRFGPLQLLRPRAAAQPAGRPGTRGGGRAAPRRCLRFSHSGRPAADVTSGSTTNGSGSKSMLNFFDRFGGGELVDRGDGENRLALIQRLDWSARDLPLGLARITVPLSVMLSAGGGQIVRGENRLDAGHRQRRARVDAADARMRHRAQQQLAEQHAVGAIVLGVLRLARSPSRPGRASCSSCRSVCTWFGGTIVRHGYALLKFSAPRIIAVRILS